MAFERSRDPEQRARRREAQRAASARRRAEMARDPRLAAAREAQRERRRQAHQAVKARRKELARERKEQRRRGPAEGLARREAEVVEGLLGGGRAEEPAGPRTSPVPGPGKVLAFPDRRPPPPPRRDGD